MVSIDSLLLFIDERPRGILFTMLAIMLLGGQTASGYLLMEKKRIDIGQEEVKLLEERYKNGYSILAKDVDNINGQIEAFVGQSEKQFLAINQTVKDLRNTIVNSGLNEAEKKLVISEINDLEKPISLLNSASSSFRTTTLKTIEPVMNKIGGVGVVAFMMVYFPTIPLIILIIVGYFLFRKPRRSKNNTITKS